MALSPLCLLIGVVLTLSSAEVCEVVDNDPCKCRTQNGYSLDLTPLKNETTFHLFNGIFGVFYYAWSPCSDSFRKPGTECVPQKEAAACQSYNHDPSQPWFNTGRASTARFDVNFETTPPNVTVHYGKGTPSGSVERETTVWLICNPVMVPGQIKDLGPNLHLHYQFQVESKYACLRQPGTTCNRVSGSSCLCQLEDERFLNLTALNSVFRHVIGTDGLTYSWGPCGKSLNEGDYCTLSANPAVCQGVGGRWYSLGQTSSADFHIEPDANPFTASVSYTGGTDKRQSKITIICDEAAIPGRLEEVYEDPALTFNFILSSKYACPVRTTA